jgi:RecA-family ATPase
VTPLDAALDYISRGWNPVPVGFRSKRPSTGDGWHLITINTDNAAQYFNGAQQNIGVQLGPASNNLIDGDMDTDQARTVAPYFMPKTKSKFGRASARCSHYLYYSDAANTPGIGAAVAFRDPITKGTIAELRIGGDGKGAQTVAPGSTHEDTGEPIVWEEDSEPARVPGDDLLKRIKIVAALSLLAAHWPERGTKARHSQALRLGGFLARCGWNEQQIELAFQAITAATNDPEVWNRKEAGRDALRNFLNGKNTFGFPALQEDFGEPIANKVAEWLDYFGGSEAKTERQEDEQPRPKLTFIDMSRWDNEPPPPREWAVLDRIPLRQTTLFSGEGAAGKSSILLHECIAHSLAKDWLGTLPEPGPAFFIECEDDDKELWRRAAAVLEHCQSTFRKAIEGGLRLKSYAGTDAVMATVSQNGKVESTAVYREVLEAAGDLKPKMIGIASSANVFAGKENDRAQVQQFIGMLTRIAIVASGGVVLASHPSLTGITNDSGISGTTQWHNAVRARFYLKTVNPEPGEQPDSDLREIVFKKNNYGPISAKMVLRYQNGLFLPVPGISSLERAAQEQTAENAFLDLLKRFTAANRKVSDRAGPGYAPAAFAREDEAKRAMLTSKDLEAAMRRLFKAEKIWNEPYGRPSRQSHHIALKT